MTDLSDRSERRFRRFGILTIASVFFLILVGGLVRSTGSGMGCPDWPKCFGTWVPPTDISQLPPDYKERFRVAGHEIADFDVYKTWTEYVNRLVGVLTGLFIFLTVFFAIPYRRKDKPVFWLSFLAFVLVGIQGWIGAKVVSSNLAHWMVTIHMLIALVIVGLLIYTITRSQSFVIPQLNNDNTLRSLMLVILLISLIQTVSGTQVRERVDEVALLMGEQNRPHWISALGQVFLFHRTFSLVSLVFMVMMLVKIRKAFARTSIMYRAALVVIILVALQVMSGKVLENFGFPRQVQSIHLLVGSLIAGNAIVYNDIDFYQNQACYAGNRYKLNTSNIHSEEVVKVSAIRQKVTDYNQLIKTRLTLLVVFSAVITYLTAARGAASINWFEVLMLAVGGILVVAASNGINQIIEKDYDKLMVRTADRPVATNRMSVQEAAIASLIMGVAGVWVIGHFLNQLCGMLALGSLISYAFIYTPLKRVSPISVFVGAFPGAFPPLLGWVAFSNNIGMEALLLFGVQFFWQFPHFWSIAWILDEDYKRAGFKMLPVYGRNRKSAFQVLIFTIMLIPVGFMPTLEGTTGIVSGIVAVIAGLTLTWFAYKLYRSCDNRDAKRLMFASFLYLPLVQIAYLIDKL